MKVKISKAHQPQMPINIEPRHSVIIGLKLLTVSRENSLTSSYQVKESELMCTKSCVVRNRATKTEAVAQQIPVKPQSSQKYKIPIMIEWQIAPEAMLMS